MKNLSLISLVVILIDILATYFGQRDNGISEVNPIGIYFLKFGKAHFLSAGIIYAFLIGLIIHKTRGWLSKLLGYSFLLGHFFGGSTWFCYSYGFGFFGIAIYGFSV